MTKFANEFRRKGEMTMAPVQTTPAPSYSGLLFIHISGPSEGYDFKVLAEPVKSLLHGDIARSPVG